MSENKTTETKKAVRGDLVQPIQNPHSELVLVQQITESLTAAMSDGTKAKVDTHAKEVDARVGMMRLIMMPVCAVILFIMFVIYFILVEKDNTPLAMTILQTVATFAIGLFGGYGLGRRK